MRTGRESEWRRGLWLGALVVGALAFVAEPARAAPRQTCAIDPGRELWIKDLSVVEDPVRTTYVAEPLDPSQGAWSFGRLLTNVAGERDPAELVLELFDHFRTTQYVNGFEVPPHRIAFRQLIEPWILASEANGLPLDFSIAPFRLNGFVNRIDLRTNGASERGWSAGEGRIVFTVLNPNGTATLFTLILEYELLASDAKGVREWAEAWHALGSIPFGRAYNEALEELVDRFAGRGVAPRRPNGSALRQLRTNEFTRQRPGLGHGDDFWQWREWQLEPESGLLLQTTTAQTVDTSLDGSALLRDYINQNALALRNGDFVVPLSFQGQPFRSAASNGAPFVAFLDAEGIQDPEARHVLSLNSCVGCHTVETDTPFFHSSPRGFGTETVLSGFLTGITVQDPADRSITRTFGDLERRRADLCQVLCSSDEVLAQEEPLTRVH